jgi:hypothetical protein
MNPGHVTVDPYLRIKTRVFRKFRDSIIGPKELKI